MIYNRYSLPVEIKATAQNGQFEGYASVFNNVDLVGDIVAPGAFTKSLNDHQTAGSTPAMLYAHNQAMPIGKWSHLEVDSYGLFVRGKLTLEVQQAKEAHALMLDDALGLSIGFATVRQADAGGANLLQEVKLHEVSLVGLPANPAAQITAVKSLAQVQSIREYETILKSQFGLSNREAKRLSGGGWYAYRGDEQELEDLAAMLRASTNRFGVR
jgi:HK97 family phage prohead protease